jgi:acetyl-CoA C-acetyltransferase
MADLLRADQKSTGLVTANGGFLTKHAIGVYSSEAPPSEFRMENMQPQVDSAGHRASVEGHEGPATVESYTVIFDRAGPKRGLAACLTPGGQRTWATTEDADVMDLMTAEEFCGRAVAMSQGTLLLR